MLNRMDSVTKNGNLLSFEVSVHPQGPGSAWAETLLLRLRGWWAGRSRGSAAPIPPRSHSRPGSSWCSSGARLPPAASGSGGPCRTSCPSCAQLSLPISAWADSEAQFGWKAASPQTSCQVALHHPNWASYSTRLFGQVLSQPPCFWTNACKSLWGQFF